MDLDKFKQQLSDLPVGLSDELKNGAENVNAMALKNQKEWEQKDRESKLCEQQRRKSKCDELAREILIASITGCTESLSTPKIESLIAQANYTASMFIRMVYEK